MFNAVSEFQPGDIAYISIHFQFFNEYHHPLPLVGDQSIMRVKGWLGKLNKSGKSVKIKFSEFNSAEYNVDSAWIKRWGEEKLLRGGLNMITKNDKVETYGEDSVLSATIRVINAEALEVLSSMVTPVATSSAKKRRRSRTTSPTSRQPTDDDSVDGGEDTKMTLVEMTSIQPASTHDDRPGGHVENELDSDPCREGGGSVWSALIVHRGSHTWRKLI